MSDTVVTMVVSLIGLCIVVISFVILAARGNKNRVVTWRGLGVTFEIKPCKACPQNELTPRSKQ